MEERFRPHRLTISRQVSDSLQDDMQRVPEAINRLCAQLLELHEGTQSLLGAQPDDSRQRRHPPDGWHLRVR